MVLQWCDTQQTAQLVAVARATLTRVWVYDSLYLFNKLGSVTESCNKYAQA